MRRLPLFPDPERYARDEHPKRDIESETCRNSRTKFITSAGSSSYTAFSMIRTFLNWSSAAQVTDLRFFTVLPDVLAAAGAGTLTGSGVDTAGETVLFGAIAFTASWNASSPLTPLTIAATALDIPAASLAGMLGFAAGAAAFLKLGSFGFDFGVEKNDESALALTAVTTTFASFFTPAFAVPGPTAIFFVGGALLLDTPAPSASFLFLLLSVYSIFINLMGIWTTD